MKLLLSKNRKTAGRPTRFVAVLMAVLLLAALIPMSGIAPGTAAFAQTISGNGYTFEDTTGELTVTSDAGTTAWRSGGINRDDIKSVVLENGVTEIGYGAFEDCYSLTDVTLSARLETIGEYAFNFCKMQSVDLSVCTNLTSIGQAAFLDCKNLEYVIFPTSLEMIDNGVFDRCTNLRRVDLSVCPNLEMIGGSAFNECSRLESIDFRGCTSLKTIGGAFSGCEMLTSVDLSPCTSLETLGRNAFAGCTSLTSVDFSGLASLKRIVGELFAGCTSLTSVDLSDCTSLQSIEFFSFADCTSLDNVVFPASLTSIEFRAFENCENLDSVIFPASLETIDDEVFSGCTSLTNMRFLGTAPPATIGTDAFKNLPSPGTLYCPKAVKEDYDTEMTSHLPSGWQVVGLSSDAGLSSVARRSISAGNQAGTAAAPKTASISVENSKADIKFWDIETTQGENATPHIYSDSGFSQSKDAAFIGLTAGADTHVYVKVVAEDGTALHYDVTVARAGAVPSVPGGGAGGDGTGGGTGGDIPGTGNGGNTPGGDSGQALAKVSSIKAAVKTIYIKKGKSLKIPYVAYGNAGYSGKTTAAWSVNKANKISVNGASPKAKKGNIKTVRLGAKSVIKVKGKKLGATKLTVKAGGKTIKFKIVVVKSQKAVKNFKAAKVSKLKVGKSKVIKISKITKKATGNVASFKIAKKYKKYLKVDAAGKLTAIKVYKNGKKAIPVKVKVGKTTKTIKVKVTKARRK